MPSTKNSQKSSRPLHVSLVALPDSMVSSLSGVYDVLNSFEVIGTFDETVPKANPFRAEIVAETRGQTGTASGLPVVPHRTVDELDRTDIIIIPAMMVEGSEWKTGRYPALVKWLKAMNAKGTLLCSACSGVLLLGETGLLDGLEATIHWAFAPTFKQNFPNVRLRLEKVLVATGIRQQFVMSGASASWHDLVLYLVARHVSPSAAQAIAKFMLLQWHSEGQGPYVMFESRLDHGDGTVREAQQWVNQHYAVASPVEEMVKKSGLAERSFKRRFTTATGYPPLAYVQQVRIEEAKRRLERTNIPVDEISWEVGYEDPAFFRRLFKRTTKMTPGAYRRKFRIPDFTLK